MPERSMKCGRRKLVWCAGAVAVFAVPAAFLWWTGNQGPVYEGRTVAQWLGVYCYTTNGDWSGRIRWASSIAAQGHDFQISMFRGAPVSNPGFDAIQRIGEPAVPQLIKALETPDSFADRYYAPRWRSLSPGWKRRFPEPAISSAEIRANAAWALGDLGTAASNAVPALIRALCEPDQGMRIQALRALSKIPDAPNVALRAWISDGRRLDLEVANALIQVETNKENSGILVASLRNPLAPARHLAVLRLASHPGAIRSEWRRLVTLLHDREPVVEDAARHSLQELHRSSVITSTEIDNFLIAATNNGDVIALVRCLRLESHETVKTLRRIMRDGTTAEKTGATRQLGYLRTKALPAMPELIAALSHEGKELRYSTVRALEALGLGAISAVPVLERALEDEHDMVSNAARRVLLQMRQGPPVPPGSDHDNLFNRK
jgi:HEAT repeat protein